MNLDILIVFRTIGALHSKRMRNLTRFYCVFLVQWSQPEFNIAGSALDLQFLHWK